MPLAFHPPPLLVFVASVSFFLIQIVIFLSVIFLIVWIVYVL